MSHSRDRLGGSLTSPLPSHLSLREGPDEDPRRDALGGDLDAFLKRGRELFDLSPLGFWAFSALPWRSVQAASRSTMLRDCRSWGGYGYDGGPEREPARAEDRRETMPRVIRSVLVSVFLVVAPALAQLPPEILVDQYLLQADQRRAQKDPAGALEMIHKILALQKEHELTLPVEFHFKYAQVAFSASLFPAALESVNQYLVAAGRKGEFYQKALELLLAIKAAAKAAADRTPCAGQPKGAECWMELANQAGCYLWNPDFHPYKTVTWTAKCTGGLAQGTGTLKWAWNTGDKLYRALKPAEKIETSSTSSDTLSAPQLRAGTPSTFRDEPTCSGQPKGTACWMELANQAGCYLWNPNLQVDETVTWTGECAEGLAQGTGTPKWVFDSGKKTQENTGHLEDGRRHGQWVIRFANGDVWEGPFVEGRMHGDWVVRWPSGSGEEGPYVEGKRHGDWVSRWPSGNVHEEEFYVDGDIVGSTAEAEVMEGLLVNGKGHGQWIIRQNDGDIEEGPYVEGKRHGPWVNRREDGSVREEGSYVDGKKQGNWVNRREDGSVYEKGSYVDGKRHGQWVRRHVDGSVYEKGSYVDGKRQGNWVVRWRSGNVEEGSYVDGKKHGRWVVRQDDGSVYEERSYVDGKKHGRWVVRQDDGGVGEGSYVQGERQGNWVERYGDGGLVTVHKGPYVEGKKHGPWVVRWSDLDFVKGSRVYRWPSWNVKKGPYVEGKRHGRWVEHYDHLGEYLWEGPYVEGKKYGDWVIYRRRDKKKRVRGGGSYVEGKRHGRWVWYSSRKKLEGTYKNGELVDN